MTDRTRRASTTDWRQVRVGAVIIVALLILAYGVVQVGSLFDVFASRYTLFMPVESTGGLIQGAPVTLAGQRVGQVEAIEFIPLSLREDKHNIMLTLDVSEDVYQLIREDSRGRIAMQGLMGTKYVNVEPGSAAYPVLEPGDTLPSEPTTDLDRILASAQQTILGAQSIIADLQVVTTSIRNGEGTLGRLIMDPELYQTATAAAENAASLLRGIEQGEGTLGRLMADTTLYSELSGAVARTDSLAALILSGQGTIGRLVRDDSLYQSLLALITNAGATVSRADSAIIGLDRFVGTLNDGNGTLSRLLNDPRLYDEFLKAVIDLQTLIAQFREQPPAVNLNLQLF